MIGRVNEGATFSGAISRLWKVRSLGEKDNSLGKYSYAKCVI